MTIVLALLATAALREPLGVWQRWAALRETPGPHCVAVAQPLRRDGTTDRRGGFALVAARAGPRRAPSVRFRLSRPRGEGAPLTLIIGERRFALIGDRESAHAADAETDRAIVGAMRGASAMTLTTLDVGGRTLNDTYPLAGAATAIDAAQLGCARR
ncbi:invasion associated locus B family protein [uncultured Sphingomonas sp.]|uniref:invasion associated locus B family protein n=1 Tax=uncultured Sphingomonas sp. TaxID=158754 RepID=UPI0030F67B18